MISLAPVLDALLALAAAAVSTAIPFIVPAVLRRLRLADNAELVARVQSAALAGAGLAYQYAAAHKEGLASVSVRNAALARGIEHVASSVPGALLELGVTPQHISQMVSGRLGVLLASDPTVTAGAPTPQGVLASPASAVAGAAVLGAPLKQLGA